MAHFLIAVADYYRAITDELLLGAKAHLEAGGHTHEIITVPGAYELPLAIHLAMHGMKHYDAYVALGCVIRGETTHYDVICEQCARGLMDISLKHQTPLGFGVLTVENEAQAIARADVNGKNKGREAAQAAMQMLALKQRFGL